MGLTKNLARLHLKKKLVEFGRVWKKLAEFGRVRQNLAGGKEKKKKEEKEEEKTPCKCESIGHQPLGAAAQKGEDQRNTFPHV